MAMIQSGGVEEGGGSCVQGLAYAPCAAARGAKDGAGSDTLKGYETH